MPQSAQRTISTGGVDWPPVGWLGVTGAEAGCGSRIDRSSSRWLGYFSLQAKMPAAFVAKLADVIQQSGRSDCCTTSDVSTGARTHATS